MIVDHNTLSSTGGQSLLVSSSCGISMCEMGLGVNAISIPGLGLYKLLFMKHSRDEVLRLP